MMMFRNYNPFDIKPKIMERLKTTEEKAMLTTLIKIGNLFQNFGGLKLEDGVMSITEMIAKIVSFVTLNKQLFKSKYEIDKIFEESISYVYADTYTTEDVKNKSIKFGKGNLNKFKNYYDGYRKNNDDLIKPTYFNPAGPENKTITIDQ
jgi:glycyl-tRNA synthetase alpha subunit